MRLKIVLMLLLWLPCTSWGFEVPDFTPNVIDTAGVLSSQEISDLNGVIEKLRAESHIFAAVLLVRSTRPDTIEQAATATFDRWKLGQRGVDNGLLFLAAIDDRRVRIEVGYGLEGSIPDIKAKQIIDDAIAPNFRKNAYFNGLSEALSICNDLVLRGDSIRLRSAPWWEKVKPRQWIMGAIWVFLIVGVPIYVRRLAVVRASTYAQELQPTPREASWWRIGFLSGPAVFLTLFLVVNPGIFVVMMNPLISPVFLAFAYLFLGAANGGYLAMLRERWRRNFKSSRSSGGRGRRREPEAFQSGFGGGSSSSGSSSSSGGGSSGGGGASGSW